MDSTTFNSVIVDGEMFRRLRRALTHVTKPSLATPAILILGTALNFAPAFSQQRPSPVPQNQRQQGQPTTQERNQQQNDDTERERGDAVVVRGSVISSTGTTMIVRTEDGEHVVVVHDRDTGGRRDAPIGSQVRVVSRRDAEGILVASNVIVDTEGTGTAVASEEPVPDDIRRLESQISRQARRFRLGVRVGVGLDPESLALGAHTKLGPFFHRDVFFRPNIEVGLGEVTTYGALNLEAVYRLPVTERQSRYSVYVGAGPGLNFLDRNFEEDADSIGDRDIDFSDFDFDASLNFLAGVEFRGGMFLELKSTAYSNPQTKIVVGYSF